ncbi:MAG: type IV pilus assembly protein PilW [Phenylobacterium sp.]|jgi:type IV pilus assembly protein PilW
MGLMFTQAKPMKKQQGMTMVEAIIALGVGVFLLGGVMSTFSAMRGTTSETLGIGEVQENGRLASSLLRRDIQHSGFWGEYQSQLNSDLLAIPARPGTDCEGGSNSTNDASFPQVSLWSFWSLWATTATTGNVLGCITDAMTNTDVLQVKRAISTPITDVDTFRSNRFYLLASPSSAAIVMGSADSATYPVIDNAKNWMYQHLVYYVANKDFYGQSVPTLMRKRLIIGTDGTASMNAEPVIDGIENIRFMFGIDIDLDGQVDSYVGSESVNREHWNQGSTDTSYILSVRIYVLARALNQDTKYSNNNSYLLGDRTVSGGGDHYRRMLFTSTVSVINSINGEWQ